MKNQAPVIFELRNLWNCQTVFSIPEINITHLGFPVFDSINQPDPPWTVAMEFDLVMRSLIIQAVCFAFVAF